MLNILVADKLSEEGLGRLDAEPELAFEVRVGFSPEALAAAVRGYDGLLIRSGAKVTAAVLRNPGRLRVIARAGVGTDNVDVEAATRAGVLVINTPDANTISTAEHTIALMLALFRHVVEAERHLRGGGWERSKFTGQQAAGKTLGIVGFGRIGQAVARRALGLEMKVIAFDPFVSGREAMEGRVRLAADLNGLLAEADCVTLHTSLGDGTRGLIGRERLARMKPSAMLINCARGALVDEAALAEALREGKLAGAAVDVFSEEPPPKNHPLLTAPRALLTPHLAASTEQAQAGVSIEAVEGLIAYLKRGEIRAAVNLPGPPVVLSPHQRQLLGLAGRMGTLLSAWCGGGVSRVDLELQDESLHAAAPLFLSQAIAGLLNPHLEGRLSLVNAGSAARERGIGAETTLRGTRPGWENTLLLSIAVPGAAHSATAAILPDRGPRILAIDGFRMEMAPEGVIAIVVNDDRPGVIGLVGTMLGDRGINIADMTLSRANGRALMVLKLDELMPKDLVQCLASHEAILEIQTAMLPAIES